jgi:DNA repair photolyase
VSHKRKPEHAVKLVTIQPKSVLNRSGMGGFTLNPYVGCTVGCAYCVEGDTLVAMADGTTRPIRDVLIGEAIIGVMREDRDGGGWSHRYTRSTILNKIETVKQAFEIVLDNGNSVICSGDHRWLTDRGWKYTAGKMQGQGRRPYLTVNNLIKGTGHAHKTPPETEGYRKGYLAGMIRGDGLLAKYDYSGKYKRRNRKHAQVKDIQYQFRLALGDIEALKRSKGYLSAFGVETIDIEFLNRSGKKPMRAIRNHSRDAFEIITALIANGDSAEWLRGWLAGIFDAEGSFSRVVRISNTDEQILRITLEAFASLGMGTVREDRVGAASNVRLRGGLNEVTRFFQITAPAISRKCDISKTALRTATRVVEIRPLGKALPMFDITTSTKNFIANGLVSHNCYVPHMAHMQLEERKWGTYVDVKENAPRLLEERLRRLKSPINVFMSTATDPYQPAEERFRITRAMLEVFSRYPQHGLFILTKQPLVERDADIISKLPRAAVGVSISVMDDGLSSVIEPWAPVTSERLALVGRLSRREIPTYILWAPVIVPVPMTDSFVADSVEAIRQCGARALSLDRMNYISRQPPGLMRRVARERHAPATAAQTLRLSNEAARIGLGRRIELLEDAPVEDAAPLLPFD